MELAKLDNRALEFEVHGTGEPVLFIHGSCLPDAFAPLLRQPAVADRYRLIRYRRQGYGASTHPSETVCMAEQAADAVALLDHLGIGCAHVVGHSLGGSIALQLALDRPASVYSLVLLEPMMLMVPGGEAVVSAVLPAVDLYLAGDKTRAVHALLELLAGEDWRARLEDRLPGAISQATLDADAFFRLEMLALAGWPITKEQTEVLPHPVLSVVGERSAPFFRAGRTLLHEWLPHTEDVDLFGTTHLLPLDDPEATASTVAWFLGKHPFLPGM
jgi:pimeloyl-ACP methyl ester carboxylesterase